MQFTAISFLLFCCLWDVKNTTDSKRKYIFILTVTNGGQWGRWGEKQLCPKGFARGFSLKMEPYQGPFHDDTSLNGIRLHCSDGSIITSLEGKFGSWLNEKACKAGFLNSFSLRVTPHQGLIDDTAAENIKFMCSDGLELEGSGHAWGKYGSWSLPCIQGVICGLQTRVEDSFPTADHTGLNNVKFFCCV